MAKLADILLTGDTRSRVIDDCVRLVDDEVAAKSGLAGMAVKAAYAIVKKITPGIIREAVDRLLNEFVGALEPFHEDTGNGAEFSRRLNGRPSEVANALLAVTDNRIGRAKNGTIRKAYEKLRPTGMKHVEAAVPGVGRVVAKYLS